MSANEKLVLDGLGFALCVSALLWLIWMGIWGPVTEATGFLVHWRALLGAGLVIMVGTCGGLFFGIVRGANRVADDNELLLVNLARNLSPEDLALLTPSVLGFPTNSPALVSLREAFVQYLDGKLKEKHRGDVKVSKELALEILMAPERRLLSEGAARMSLDLALCSPNLTKAELLALLAEFQKMPVFPIIFKLLDSVWDSLIRRSVGNPEWRLTMEEAMPLYDPNNGHLVSNAVFAWIISCIDSPETRNHIESWKKVRFNFERDVPPVSENKPDVGANYPQCSATKVG